MDGFYTTNNRFWAFSEGELITLLDGLTKACVWNTPVMVSNQGGYAGSTESSLISEIQQELNNKRQHSRKIGVFCANVK